VPPIKSQGIKTKLVSWIKSVIPSDFHGAWVEPFMGTGVVAFNVASPWAVLCDTNPYLVEFYAGIDAGEITPEIVREYLTREGAALLERGEAYYYFIRDRFNKDHSPLDFLFLNRACFNGVLRFNQRGGFNVPFCRNSRRFAQAHVTKIVNQVAYVAKLLGEGNYRFLCQDFRKTIAEAESSDIIYCDPPYIGRNVVYHNGWDGNDEAALFEALSRFTGRFILSTWHHDDRRENEYVKELWAKYNVLTREHFYQVGPKIENRGPVVEALVTNFPV
jgi:DNA adenine methylase